jgi:hypothetical protein
VRSANKVNIHELGIRSQQREMATWTARRQSPSSSLALLNLAQRRRQWVRRIQRIVVERREVKPVNTNRTGIRPIGPGDEIEERRLARAS